MILFRRFRGPKLVCGCLFALLCILGANGQESTRKIVKEVEPEYPRVLKKMEIGGVVRLKVTIRPDGTVVGSEVLGGNPILAGEAQKAVAQWKFAPGPNTSSAEVKITFDPHKT